MVDLTMMTNLVRALPKGAQLVLLGDPKQLASVEAGAVLANICAAAAGAGARVDLQASVCRLRHNHRSGAAPQLSALLDHVRNGEVDEAYALLTTDQQPDVKFVAAGDRKAFAAAIGKRVVADRDAATPFVEYLELVHGVTRFDPTEEQEIQAHVQKIFTALRSLTILCAVRRGPRGVHTVNRIVEQALAHQKSKVSGRPLLSPDETWYPGRPVMATRNDYSIKLFNGDVGVVLEWPTSSGPQKVVVFPDADQAGACRQVSPLRVPECETVFAMTVHKSQGSEYRHVILVLPERKHRILTRELLYTGISRASQTIEIWGAGDVFVAACNEVTRRDSGLAEWLQAKS